ncbi:MAG: ROK family protein [Clostridia bacterium]|nr:ROK family protein [Clostridia bacterium]
MKYYLGIDLGGTNIKAGITDETGTILYKNAVRTLGQRPAEEIAKDMIDLCRFICRNAEIPLEQVEAVGIGIPGTVDEKKGTIVYANNLHMDGFPIGAVIGKALGKPVYLSNDANCAALGEFVNGSGKNYDSIVMVTLGTGVGGGIILKGKLWGGLDGSAAEIGHMVLKAGGEACSCGRTGCWEAYSSATALIRDTVRAMKKHPESLLNTIQPDLKKVSAKTAFLGLAKGDAVAKEVVEQYLYYLSEGIANIINTLAPDAVILGGGVCNEGDTLLRPLRELVYPKCYGGETVRHPDLKIASMGNDAGIVGAAMLWNS